MARKSPVPSKDTTAAVRRQRRAARPAAPADAAPQPSVDGAPTDTMMAEPVVAQHVPDSKPATVIELDPLAPGGFIGDRFDILLRGRICSITPIVEVRLQIGERVIGVASFGEEPAETTVAPTGGGPALRHLFQFTLPRAGEEAAAPCPFQIIGRSEDGTEQTETYELHPDAATGQNHVVGGPTAADVLAGPIRPAIVIYIERALLDPDGVLSVSGWALASAPVLALQIFAGEERVGKARLTEERADVAAAHPAYPNALLSGFSLTTSLPDLDPDPRCVRVQLVCPNGFGQEASAPIERTPKSLRPTNAEIGADTAPPEAAPPASSNAAPLVALFNQRPSYRLTTAFHIEDEPIVGLVLATPAARSGVAATPAPTPAPPAVTAPRSSEIRMFCDTAVLTSDGHLRLSGWAVCAIGVAQVRVLLDDQVVGLASYGHDRPDVGAAFPDIAHAGLSGFRFDQNIGGHYAGEHIVRVVVRNLANDEKDDRLPTIATEVVPAAPDLLPVEVAATSVGPAFTAEQLEEFKFELDSPALVNGAAAEVIAGRLTVDGWLLSKSGVDSFQIFIDDQLLGDVHYGLARQDVGTAFPEWPNSVRSGYAFHCPPRSLKDGEHMVRLLVRSKSGVDIERNFRITVKKADEHEEQSGIRRRVPRVEADMLLALLTDLNYRPSIRCIIRQGADINIDALTRTLDALRLQEYDRWTALILVPDAGVAAALGVVIDEAVPHLADRFAMQSADDVAGWTAPLTHGALGRDALHVPLSAGDEPGADAFLELAVGLARHPTAGLAYGDEVRRSPVAGEMEAFFKPDWSPDLLTAMNYFGRLWAATDAVLAATGASPDSLTRDGEYDLALRCADMAGTIHHVRKLLCQRGAGDIDTAEQEKAALEALLIRRGISGTVEPTPITGTWRLRRAVGTQGLVSIIIPTCAASGYIEGCITSLRTQTAYRNYEIIVIDNIPTSEAHWKTWVRHNADRVIDIPDAFNWSVFNNRAAAAAQGEFLLFLNDDITITWPDWLDALLEHAQRPEVGIVGPQLLYPDGKVQHAGMFLAHNGVGRHAFRFAAHDDPCYFGLALTQRNVIAVTGACMLMRRETFEAVGRFEEAHEIVNNDLDFCLRAHKAGLLTIFTPYASMTHHELASRARMKDVFDLTHFNAQWKTTFAAGDPYFSPRLWRDADDYRPDEEPVQWVVSGHPLFHAAEIQRILVVKLDHIGDFVTALPPIRRLKALFPHAHLTVLAGPASRAFVALEPAIDAFIPFEFFHARSQLGERSLAPEDFQALARQLKPQRFDLAVDLRKHPSTRDVLTYTGARFLAGFDYLGQFPNLDIALDWDGDRTLQRKRSHIVVDLMGLVNAIGNAVEPDRVLMKAPPAPMPTSDMPPTVAALFSRRVVAVHTGAGNITKQWPETHFAALIDLLIERNDVNVLLIGGPDEVDIANRVQASVLHGDRVGNMVGGTSLAALPALLRTCALYIGNDSGPKHIAAAVGIPTIGIHSGVVDPVEWGPIGPAAVALRRNMTCSPCYLANAEDCPRALACLRFLEPNVVHETADLLLSQPSYAEPAERSRNPGGQARPRKSSRRAKGGTQPLTAESA